MRGDPICRREDCSPFDIGLNFKEIGSSLSQDKLGFIENVWKPGEIFDFPLSIENRKPRKFVFEWLRRYPWLAYSKYLDGAFCFPCVLFGVESGRNAHKLDKLLKSPLTCWTSAASRLTKHASGKCEMHNFAVIVMDNFLKTMRQQAVPVDQQLNNIIQQQIDRNRTVLKSLFETIIFCGRNNIALRGQRDDDPTNASLSGNNAAARNPEEYYRTNLTVVFLDHIVQQLNNRFQDDVFVCYRALSVIPSIMLATGIVWKDNVLAFCEHYRQDIPNYAGLQAELILWERMWMRKDDLGEEIPDSLEGTLEHIDNVAYANIHTILQILITIPMSSASCERSISTLRNLKNYLRNTMAQDRMNGLALMHSHRDMDLDLEEIIDLFATLNPRRMRMENILQ